MSSAVFSGPKVSRNVASATLASALASDTFAARIVIDSDDIAICNKRHCLHRMDRQAAASYRFHGPWSLNRQQQKDGWMSDLADSFRYIRVDCDDRVLTITIDRPDVLNALHLDAHVELSRAFDIYAGDASLRVAIITGSGDRAFCVGTDLKSLAKTGEYEYPSGGFAGITRRFDLWKPVIAAVNGLCLGGGLEIVAACDLAIASEHAEFGLPEPRVGLAALGGGGLQRLARHLPLKYAMDLVLTGRRIGAEEAKRIGLINDVTPRAELKARVRAVADMIIAGAPLAVEASKQVMLMSLAMPDLPTALRARYPAAERMLASEDAKEGQRAFVEKRQPHWQGR